MSDKINGRTPEEIKELLANYKNYTFSAEALYADALAYIQQLEDHFRDLTKKVEQLERERDAAVAETESLNAEIDAINEDYLSGIHTVREDAQPKWISVGERLPEESETVLVYRDGCCGVARLLDVEPEIMWTYTGFGGDPTHWMLLPEAPKEEK